MCGSYFSSRVSFLLILFSWNYLIKKTLVPDLLPGINCWERSIWKMKLAALTSHLSTVSDYLILKDFGWSVSLRYGNSLCIMCIVMPFFPLLSPSPSLHPFLPPPTPTLLPSFHSIVTLDGSHGLLFAVFPVINLCNTPWRHIPSNEFNTTPCTPLAPLRAREKGDNGWHTAAHTLRPEPTLSW